LSHIELKQPSLVPGSFAARPALKHANVFPGANVQHGPDQILWLAAPTGFDRLQFDLLDFLRIALMDLPSSEANP